MNRKRAAIEPASALLSHEAPLPADARRPVSVTLGAAFVLSRAVSATFWLIIIAVVWHEIAAELGLGHGEAVILFWLLAIVNIVTTLVLLLFAWLIWRGSNAARVITMLVLTFSIIVAAIGHFSYGETITLHTTLLTLALDILILLALSSRDARAWTRRQR